MEEEEFGEDGDGDWIFGVWYDATEKWFRIYNGGILGKTNYDR